MRIITLWEPWSTLLALGEKKIETRGWSTNYRGPVAIHSAKGGLGYGELIRTYFDDPFCSCLLKDEGFAAWAEKWKTCSQNPRHALPVGHIIAVGNLIDCVRSESYRCLPGVFGYYPELDTPQERVFGNYEPGRFGLVFVSVKRLREPVPFKSRQGKLLDIDPVTEALVRAQL